MRTNYRNGDEIRLQENGCDGCSPSAINGTLCHESGCSDSWRDYSSDCFECGCEYLPTSCRQSVCDDCDGNDAHFETNEEFADEIIYGE